jgi:outer membrane receptor protein involved in Fe transport
LELQDNLTLGRHALSLGANMRLVGIEVSDYPVSKSQWVLTPATGLYFVKDKTDETLSGAFLQDRVTFTDQFDLTLGAKAEDWTLLDSGAEISPSLRLRYRPVEGTTLWAAASRSITTPGYAQSSIEIPIFQMPPAWFYQMQGLTPPPTAGLWMSILSQPDVKPTEYQTLEFGLRRPLTQTLNLDLSTYYTQMDDRIDAEPVNGLLPSSLDPTQLVMPYLYSNIFKGTMFGGELVMRWLPFHGLRSEFSYSLYRSFLKGKNGIADPNPDYPNSPEHVFRTRQYWDPMPGLEVSGNLTWTSPYNRGSYNYNSLNGLTFGTPGSETKDKPANRVILDLQVAKTMLEDQLSVGVWGHDLLAGDLLDVYNAGPGLLTPTRLSPTFGANLSWKF